MNVQIVVPWRDSGCPHRRAAWAWCRRRWEFLTACDMTNRWLPIATADPPGEWSMAKALNECLRQARGDVVVLMGADVALNRDTLRAAVDAASDAPWVLPTTRLQRMRQATSDRTLASPIDTELDPHGCENIEVFNAGWGPVIGPLDALRTVGYDEQFTGWGCEDDAFTIAATALIGPPTRLDGDAFLLWHPPPPARTFGANQDRLEEYKAAHGNPTVLRALAGAGVSA